MKIKIIFLAVLLQGCALPGTVGTNVLEDDVKLCTTIKNIDNILPTYVRIKNRDSNLGAEIPNTPISADLSIKSSNEVVQLSEMLNQDNIALRSFQYLIIVGRNAAPCDKDNVRMFWESVDNLVNKTYLLRDKMIKTVK